MQNEITVRGSLVFTPLHLYEAKTEHLCEIWERPEKSFSLDEGRTAGVSEFECEGGKASGTFTVLKSFVVEYLDFDTRINVNKSLQKLATCKFMAEEDFCVAYGDKAAVDSFKAYNGLGLRNCWFDESTLEYDSLNLSGITFANPKSFRLRKGTVETESPLDASNYIKPQSKIKSVTFSLEGTGLLKSVTLRDNGTASIKTHGLVAMTFQTLKEIMSFFRKRT